MKYAAYNSDGEIIGFYTEDIHGKKGSPDSKIPERSIPITDEQWMDMLENHGKWKVDTATGTLVLAPPPPPPALEDVKLHTIEAIKREAFHRLSETDWYIVREVETSKPVPAQVLAYRTAIRDRVHQAEADIHQATSIEEVFSYVIEWPEAPDEVVLTR